MDIPLQAVFGSYGVAAVVAFDPFHSCEETPHFGIAGSLGEVAHQVDEFVAVPVVSMPQKWLDTRWTHTARETVGEEPFCADGVFYIALLRKVVDKSFEGFGPCIQHIAMESEVFVAVRGLAQTIEIVFR